MFNKLFIQDSYLICYFICNACLGSGHASKLYTKTILFIDDNKHSKIVRLQKWANLPIFQSQLHTPLAPGRQLVTSSILTSSFIKTEQSSVSFGPSLNHSGVNSPTYFHFRILWNKNVFLLWKEFQTKMSRPEFIKLCILSMCSLFYNEAHLNSWVDE